MNSTILAAMVAALMTVSATALAQNTPNPTPADGSRAAQWCSANPDKCAQMKNRRDAMKAKCDAAPDQCKAMRDKVKERRDDMKSRRDAMKAKCDANPDQCKAMRDKVKERRRQYMPGQDGTPGGQQ